MSYRAKTLSLGALALLTCPSHALAGPVNPVAYAPYEQRHFAKLFAKWGPQAIAKINALRKQAAEIIALSQECDAGDVAELSDNRSNPPSEVVIYVDCKNDNRFYLTSAEIAAKTFPVSQTSKMAALSDSAATLACEARVRGSLHFPSTMDRKWASTNVYRAPSTGRVVVSFNFEAKNVLGNMLPYQARCYFDDRGLGEPEISPR